MDKEKLKSNWVDCGDNDKEFYFFIKSLNNFNERDLIDYIEMRYNIVIVKYSLEYKEDGSYFEVEKYIER